MIRVLLVEDDPHARAAVLECVEAAGFDVVTATDRTTALAELAVSEFDLLLCDVFLPDGTCFDVLREGDHASADLYVILMSGDLDATRAFSGDKLRSMKFVAKPLDFEAFRATLDEVAATLAKDKRSDSADVVRGADRILGSSEAMERVRDLARRVAPSDFSVYIQGESGVGKELVARAIHEMSPRRKQPFVAVNCGAIPDSLVDSELFGHERGAFTGANARRAGVFEQANGGTLFLDEIAEMPVELQVRLLRALEENVVRRVGGNKDIQIDVRIISATNRDFASAIESGDFREDLFYRLCVMPITIPPLRVRSGDVAELVDHFLALHGRKSGERLEFGEEALERLSRHPFPGNVRELRNVVQRAILLADGEIGVEHLHLQKSEFGGDTTGDPTRLIVRVGDSIADAERRLIQATIDHEGGDKRAAAVSLGVSLRTLYNRLRDYSVRGQADADGSSAGLESE